MCIYLRIFLHVYIRVYIYVYISVLIENHMLLRHLSLSPFAENRFIYTIVYVYVCTYIFVCVHMYVYIYIHICHDSKSYINTTPQPLSFCWDYTIGVNVSLYTCMYVRIYIHLYIRVYIYMYIYHIYVYISVVIGSHMLLRQLSLSLFAENIK